MIALDACAWLSRREASLSARWAPRGGPVVESLGGSSSLLKSSGYPESPRGLLLEVSGRHSRHWTVAAVDTASISGHQAERSI